MTWLNDFDKLEGTTFLGIVFGIFGILIPGYSYIYRFQYAENILNLKEINPFTLLLTIAYYSVPLFFCGLMVSLLIIDNNKLKSDAGSVLFLAGVYTIINFYLSIAIFIILNLIKPNFVPLIYFIWGYFFAISLIMAVRTDSDNIMKKIKKRTKELSNKYDKFINKNRKMRKLNK